MVVVIVGMKVHVVSWKPSSRSRSLLLLTWVTARELFVKMDPKVECLLDLGSLKEDDPREYAQSSRGRVIDWYASVGV